MLLADWIMLGVIAVVIILGLVAGFSGGLRFFTGGIFGVIISIIVTYFLLGVVNSWQFVQDLLAKLNDAMPGFLQTIHAATIIYYILLFLIVQILRVLIVRLLAGAFSAPAAPVRVINRILGMVLMVAAVFLLLLLVFAVFRVLQDTSFVQNILDSLNGTFLGKIYENNPVKFVQ